MYATLGMSGATITDSGEDLSPHFPHARRSFASRVSLRIATRLSIVGLRETPREGTVAGVTVNTLCNVMGAGVLALPLATRNASVGLALLLLAYVATMSAYAVYCLVAACDATERFSVTEVTAYALFPSRRFDRFCASMRERSRASGSCAPRRGASAAAAAAAGEEGEGAEGGGGGGRCTRGAAPTTSQFREWERQHAKDEARRRRWRRVTTVVVESIIFCSNFGTLVVYARVIADSMPPVVDNVCRQLKWEPFPVLTHEGLWLATSGVTFFLLSCARGMEELKWSSLIGFLTVGFVVLVVVYRFHTASWSSDPIENAKGFPSIDPEARGTILWFALPATALRTVSVYSVAFGYHFNVPYFYSEMRHRVPSEMLKSVALSFPIIVASYAATGVFGYLTFGDLVASAQAGGNIVMNYPKTDWLVNAARLGLFLHFACVFPIVSICARRSLHRLAMTALTWGEQSSLMESEVRRLEEAEEESERRQRYRQERDSGYSAHDPGEESPLLGEQLHRQRPPHLRRSGSGQGRPASFAGRAAPDLAELDRDVGAPDDTTRTAIVSEALLLVSGSVLLAATVPGIGVVIDLVGSLFGSFLILIVPGVVGMRVFSVSFLFDSSHVATASGEAEERGRATVGETAITGGVRYARVKWWLCALSAVTGVVFTAVASTVFVVDHVSLRRE